MPRNEKDEPQEKKTDGESDGTVIKDEAEAPIEKETDSGNVDATESRDEKGVLKAEGKIDPEELLRVLQRTTADFENFRKRTERSIVEARRSANDDLILRFLDIYDSLERAARTDFAVNPEAAREGITAIVLQMWKIMAQEQVRPIESLGAQYDPYYQYSVSRANDPAKPDRTVIEEYQRGYMIREKVLRPALVCVNRHEIPAPEELDLDNEDEHKEDGE